MSRVGCTMLVNGSARKQLPPTRIRKSRYSMVLLTMSR
jgi:hypothetical protein